MSGYLGDFSEDATVRFMFTTHAQSGAAVAPSTALEAADLVIYKDNGAAQKTTANGVTMTSPFDSTTGLHAVAIDTSNDTGDTDFWAAGSDYTVILVPSDETVDGLTVLKVVAHFSIENRSNQLALLETGVTNKQALQAVSAILAGLVSGAGTASEVFKAIGAASGGTTRVTVVPDASGNRSAVTIAP